MSIPGGGGNWEVEREITAVAAARGMGPGHRFVGLNPKTAISINPFRPGHSSFESTQIIIFWL